MNATAGTMGGRIGLGVTALAAWALGGCAYLTTFTRAVDLENTSYAMDIKQRVVVSKARDAAGLRVVCAEPSPDAITTIAASAGLDVAATLTTAAKTPGEDGVGETSEQKRAQKNLTAALAEQGAFVGLRTQSIQLLRDAMYRLCEGYASGAVDEAGFTAMQKRYQSTMLGLLAIEQLTRPVVAAQVALTSTASAASGQTAEDARVTELENKVDSLQTELAAKDADVINARAALADAELAVLKNRDDAEAARKKAPEGKADEAAKQFDDALPSLETTQRTARKDLEIAEAQRRATQSNLERARDALNKAQGRASAAASGGAAFGAIGGASASMTKSMATEVTAIVTEVNKTYLLNDCLTFLIGREARQAAATTQLKELVQRQKDKQSDPALEAAIGAQVEAARKLASADASIAEACAAAFATSLKR